MNVKAVDPQISQIDADYGLKDSDLRRIGVIGVICGQEDLNVKAVDPQISQVDADYGLKDSDLERSV